MARSVSYANGSEVVIYSHFEVNEDDSYFAQEAFDDTLDYLKDQLFDSFPSLRPSDAWCGREDIAFVQNDLVYIGLSEYCGLVSVWVKPKDTEYTQFGVRFARQIEKKLESFVKNAFGTVLNRVGAFSNGEVVFREKA